MGYLPRALKQAGVSIDKTQRFAYTMSGGSATIKGSGTMQRKAECGFTLIELLVVISIIAILASFIFPTFAKAREKARQIQCTSNLHQIQTSLDMYMLDSDQTFPNYGYVDSQGKWQPWRFGQFCYSLTQSYVKDRRVFRCPTAPEPNLLPEADTPEAPSAPIQTLVVNENGRDVEYRSDYCPNLGGYPAGKVLDLVADSTSNCAILADYPSAPYSERHTGGITICFADGHLKWYPFRIARPMAFTKGQTDDSREWYQWGWNETRGKYVGWPDVPSGG